jgi:hypothetical protein
VGRAPDDTSARRELESVARNREVTAASQLLKGVTDLVVELCRGRDTHMGARKAPLGMSGLDVLTDRRLPRLGFTASLTQNRENVASGEFFDDVVRLEVTYRGILLPQRQERLAEGWCAAPIALDDRERRADTGEYDFPLHPVQALARSRELIGRMQFGLLGCGNLPVDRGVIPAGELLTASDHGGREVHRVNPFDVGRDTAGDVTGPQPRSRTAPPSARVRSWSIASTG